MNDGPATLTALANAEGMRPQSMSAIVAVLVAADFIEGKPDPTDRRQTILALTDHARYTVNVSRAAKDDWLYQSMKSKLSPSEQSQLVGSIQLLKRLLEH